MEAGQSDTQADTITIRYRWTANELINGQRWHHRHDLRRVLRRCLVLLSLLFIGFGIYLTLTLRVSGALYIGLGFLVIMYQPFIVPLVVRHKFDRRPDARAQIKWVISAADLRISEPNGTAELSWDSFVKVVRTPDGFLLYPIPRVFHWLPRSGFGSDQDFERFAELAASRIDDYRSAT